MIRGDGSYCIRYVWKSWKLIQGLFLGILVRMRVTRDLNKSAEMERLSLDVILDKID